jgi:hypothetical protein
MTLQLTPTVRFFAEAPFRIGRVVGAVKKGGEA